MYTLVVLLKQVTAVFKSLKVVQLGDKLPAFYGTWRFTVVFT
jgi:hypothetical protein